MNKKQILNMINSRAYGLRIALAGVCAACLIAGCATYPPREAPPVDKSMSFSVPYDIAWKKMLELVTQEGEHVNAADRDGGIISLQKNIPPQAISQYAYDDTGMFWSQAVANVNILIAQQDERSTTITINVKVDATGRDFFDVIFSRARQMTLHSRGYLERYYLSKFSKIIAALKAPAQE